MKKIIIIALSIASINAIAQTKKMAKVVNKTIATTASSKNGYQVLKPGVEYKLFSKNNGQLIKDSTFVLMHNVQKIGDSVFSSTFKTPGAPVMNFVVKTTAAQTLDFNDLFLKMRNGDSAVIRLNKDSVFHGNTPPFVKPTDELTVLVSIKSVFTNKQKDSIFADNNKRMMEQQMMQEQQKAEQQKGNAELAITQAKTIEEYAAKNKIIVTKTASGLYYAITQKGTGAMPKVGQNIVMNYTGMDLEGKKFDSNVDPAFNHVQPFDFPLGQGRVIQGWDEGIALMPVGTKGILLIPSYLAYGAQGAGGAIGPNQILRFDVEVVSAK
jgi:FKBP-type peptidyl-prolyl cis-trans isomerase FkpA